MATPERHEGPRVGIAGTGAVASALAAELSSAGLAVMVWGRDAGALCGSRATGAAHARSSRSWGGRRGDPRGLGRRGRRVAGALAAREGLPAPLPHGRPDGGAIHGGRGARRRLGSIHPLVAVPQAAATGLRGAVSRACPSPSRRAARTRWRSRGDRRGGGGGLHRGPARGQARLPRPRDFVATGVVSLVDRAARALLEASDGENAEAFRRAYGRLALSAASNLDELDGAEALTGALARGDEALIAGTARPSKRSRGARPLRRDHRRGADARPRRRGAAGRTP